jgi:hypothetical protein
MAVLFHAEETPPAELKGITTRGAPFDVTLQSMQDPTWAWFDREMKPTGLEMEYSQNIQLHHTLREQGDDASKERRVDFTCYFPTEAEREAFISEVMHEGFLTDEESRGISEKSERKFIADMRYVTTVGAAEMADHCLYIREAAARSNGVFDGWGCPIEK